MMTLRVFCNGRTADALEIRHAIHPHNAHSSPDVAEKEREEVVNALDSEWDLKHSAPA